jgi:ATP-dependent Clp protease adaptor protein ClpS
MSESSSSTSEKTAAATPKPATKPEPKQLPPYNVILLNDDDHTYDYVIEMLRALFGHSEQRAYQMARTVDHQGRVIVFTTHKERAELKRDQIRGYGLDPRIDACTGSMAAVIEPAEG